MQWIAEGYWAAVVATLLFSLLLCWQSFEHRRYARNRCSPKKITPRRRHMALFVPCKGLDDDLEANLRPLFEQDHVSYELVFVVESGDDPACLPIRKLVAQYPAVQARIMIAGLSTNCGQKVHNLLVATERLPERVEILVFVDADVRPPRDWLWLLTERLEKFGVSTGYRCFVPKRQTLANWLLTSLNGSVVPIMFPGKHHLVWGGSWAIRRSVFEASGIRDAWQGTLSDDLIATRVTAKIGQRVIAEPSCILPSPLDVTFRGMLAFVRRQLLIGRCYTPILWFALLVGTCIVQSAFWGSLAATIWGCCTGAKWTWEPAVTLASLYALHVIRAYLRQDASRYYIPSRQRELAAAWRFDMWLGPLAGLIGWMVLAGSAVGNRIVWRSITYEMRQGGQIRYIIRQPAAPVATGCKSRKAA